MKKLFVVLFSGSLLSISFFNLTKSLYYLPVLVNLSRPYVIMRTVLVAILICYTFIPRLRLHLVKNLLNLSGLLLLTLGIFTIMSPGLLGHLNDWILLGDSIILIEAGILAIILSSELPYKPPKFLFGAIYFTRSIFEVVTKKFVYAFRVIDTKSITQSKRLSATNIITSFINDLTRIYEVANKVPP